jgi:hypothetical protein
VNRGLVLVAAATFAAVVVAACSLVPFATDPIAPPSAVPAEVASRPPLPPCGTETFTTQAGPTNAAGRACLWAAYVSGNPAEFSSTRPTVEGDPITMIYRVLGTGIVQVFVDSTHDRFAAQVWTRLDCTTLSGSASEFGPDQCTETPVR